MIDDNHHGILMSFTKSKSVVVLGIIAFLVMSLLGFYSMPTDKHGKMSNCPFTGVTTVCEMNPLEHIIAWQNMFTVSSQKDTFTFAILFFLALLIALLLENFWRTRTKESLSTQAIRDRQTNILLIQNPLQKAFSDGILHPKMF